MFCFISLVIWGSCLQYWFNITKYKTFVLYWSQNAGIDPTSNMHIQRICLKNSLSTSIKSRLCSLLLPLYFCKAVVLLGQGLSLRADTRSLLCEQNFPAGPLGLNCPVCVLARRKISAALTQSCSRWIQRDISKIFSSFRYAWLPVAIHSVWPYRSKKLTRNLEQTSVCSLSKKTVFPDSDIVVFPLSSNESVFGTITSDEERFQTVWIHVERFTRKGGALEWMGVGSG